MQEKSAYQKMYEKKRMIELLPAEITVMCGERRHKESGIALIEPGLYLCVGNMPVAKLLPKSELDETTPDFKKSKAVQECFDRMQDSDPRNAESDFNVVVGNGFEEEFLRAVDDIPEGDEA